MHVCYSVLYTLRSIISHNRFENGSALSEELPQAGPEGLDDVQPGYLGTTPPPGVAPQRGERSWVDRPEQLLQAVSVLKQSTVVAVDAEFTQARSRAQHEVSSTPRLSLLQLAIDRHCFVVDTLRLHDLSPLAEIVGSQEIVVLLHGAGADMRVMAERGLNVIHYYDLEATSRSIFGQHESSLAAMLLRAFNIRLDKSLQRTDWARRPLPPAMIAYAARDAEVTLALYYWLDEHFHDVLQLHESNGQPEAIASWIEPFLRGSSSASPEVAITEAKAQGMIANKAQMVADCRAALQHITHPMRRSRLLRLIADLGLTQLAPDIEPLLEAPTSDERSGSARALGRLGLKAARERVRPLLQDPVQDVRKAAQTALRNLGEKEPRVQHATPTRSADGVRTWTIEAASSPGTNEAGESDDGNDWKARLRSMMGD